MPRNSYRTFRCGVCSRPGHLVVVRTLRPLPKHFMSTPYAAFSAEELRLADYLFYRRDLKASSDTKTLSTQTRRPISEDRPFGRPRVRLPGATAGTIDVFAAKRLYEELDYAKHELAVVKGSQQQSLLGTQLKDARESIKLLEDTLSSERAKAIEDKVQAENEIAATLEQRTEEIRSQFREKLAEDLKVWKGTLWAVTLTQDQALGLVEKNSTIAAIFEKKIHTKIAMMIAGTAPDGFTDAQLRELLASNSTARALFTSNLKKKLETETAKITDQLKNQYEATLSKDGESVEVASGEELEGNKVTADEYSREEWEQYLIEEVDRLQAEHKEEMKIVMDRAELTKNNAVQLIESRAGLKINMAENRLRLASIKLEVLKTLAKDSPEMPAKAVWDKISSTQLPPPTTLKDRSATTSSLLLASVTSQSSFLEKEPANPFLRWQGTGSFGSFLVSEGKSVLQGDGIFGAKKPSDATTAVKREREESETRGSEETAKKARTE